MARFENVLKILLIVVPLAFVPLYQRGLISLFGLIFVVITIILALIPLLLPHNGTGKVPTFKIPISLLIFSVIVYVVGQVEILIYRHTELSYLLILLSLLIMTVLSDEKPIKIIITTTAIVATTFIPLYSLYNPPFGFDTWRDTIWASHLLNEGYITESGIRHHAYPFPMVPLLYALTSLVSELDVAWTNVVIGLTYLLQLSLLTFLLSRRLTGLADFSGTFLILMAPLAVLWSVWYIPQVFSLTLFLTVLATQPTTTLQIPLLIAGVFGHGGVASWMVVTLFAIWLSTRERKTLLTLLYLVVVFIAYASYTTLLYAVSAGYRNVVETILAFLRGEKIITSTAPVVVQ